MFQKRAALSGVTWLLFFAGALVNPHTAASDDAEPDLSRPAAVPDLVQGQPAPPLRRMDELTTLLAELRQPGPSDQAPLKIVLCASEKDPGHRDPGFHDYPLWRERWAGLFREVKGVTVETADRWPTTEQIASADVVVFYHDNPAWDPQKAEDLDRMLERGAGLVFLHWSINAYRDFDPLAARLGKAWGSGANFRQGPLALRFIDHELTHGLGPEEHFVDEPYGNLPGPGGDLQVLAVSPEADGPQPQVWLRTVSDGRIFVCLPGHFTWTLDDPLYRWLVFRGICWAAHQPLGRLNPAVLRGARVVP